ncbi:hypothetical protein ALC53_08539 [Atta colombica]|uniref:Uncharacterized protein n=1 Tax=Atta colombica TaxID=520822 RepID=A0A151I2R1_9HYME|nr:hypothetical protein ALC53_08539 [Atta colombica]
MTATTVAVAMLDGGGDGGGDCGGGGGRAGCGRLDKQETIGSITSGDESSVFLSVFLDLQCHATKQHETAKLALPSPWMCSRFLAGGKRMCRGRINGIWRTHEEDERPSGFELTYVFDFPTIDQLNELSIFVSNFIVFDVQISSILSIYTKSRKYLRSNYTKALRRKFGVNRVIDKIRREFSSREKRGNREESSYRTPRTSREKSTPRSILRVPQSTRCNYAPGDDVTRSYTRRPRNDEAIQSGDEKNGVMNCFSRQRRVFSGASGVHPRSMPNDRKRRCALVSGVGPTLPTEVVAEELADPKHVQP